MVIDRIVSMILRVAELVFAAIVAGVTGAYLHQSSAGSWALGRFIYTQVVSALAILFALLLLIPFSSTFTSWPLDVFMSVLWWIVFGLLVDVSPSSAVLLQEQCPMMDRCTVMDADASLTGATSPHAATNAAGSRPTWPLLSCLPSSGSSPPSSASSGSVAVKAVLPAPMPPTVADVAGVAATSKDTSATRRMQLWTKITS